MAIKVVFRDGKETMVCVSNEDIYVTAQGGWVLIEDTKLLAMYREDSVYSVERIPDLPEELHTCV